MSVPQFYSDNPTIDLAIAHLLAFGCIDGAHHKQWVIDQTIRILAGADYEKCIAYWEQPEGDGHSTWDKGIPP